MRTFLLLCVTAALFRQNDPPDNDGFVLRIADDESKILLATLTSQKSTQLLDDNLNYFDKPTLTIFNEASKLNDTLIIKASTGTFNNTTKLLTLQGGISINSASKAIRGSADAIQWTKDHKLTIAGKSALCDVYLKDIFISATSIVLSKDSGGAKLSASDVSKFICKSINFNADCVSKELLCLLSSSGGDLTPEQLTLSGDVRALMNGGRIKCEYLDYNVRKASGACRGSPRVTYQNDSNELLAPILEISGEYMLAYPPVMLVMRSDNTSIHSQNPMTFRGAAADMLNCRVITGGVAAEINDVAVRNGKIIASGGILTDFNRTNLHCDRGIISTDSTSFGSLVLISSKALDVSAITAKVSISMADGAIGIGSENKRAIFIKGR